MLFGASLISAEELASVLVSRVAKRANELGNSNRAWTKAICEALEDAAKERKLNVRCYTNWMLDATWISDKGIELAVESEWGGKGQVLDDFVKLLFVKAPLKMMIYQASSSSSKIRGEIVDHMTAFDRHVGEEYVLLEYEADKPQPLKFHVEHDGKQESIKFLPISVLALASSP